MHQLFFPLDKRQYMLLLTAMTVGGSESIQLFQYLPDEEKQLLLEKSELLKQIPTTKRVPFMVKEMKEELRIMGQRGIEYIDPSWLLSILKGETPRTVATLLISLPTPVVRKIIERIPAKVRQRLPPKDEIQNLPQEIKEAVRFTFEQKFFMMPRFMGKNFVFSNVILLDRKELHTLTRNLGIEELAQAFISVGKRALGELCRRLPKKYADELIETVKYVDRTDIMDVKTAQRFLARVLMNFKDTEELFQKAGLFRIAKAALLEDTHFKKAFMQRLPKEAGQLFSYYVEKAGEIGEWEDDTLKSLQDRILLRIQELAKNNTISSRYANLNYHLHNPHVNNPEQPAG